MDTATLGQLVTLAAHDRRIRELDQRIAAGPEKLARLNERREKLRTGQRELEAELEDVQKRRRALEQEANTIIQKVHAFESQLAAVKSNDEYQAMVKQIGDSRTRSAGLENQALELMEREEALDSRVRVEKTRIASEIDDCDHDEQELEAQLADQRSQRETVIADRERAVEALTADVRARYERMRSGSRGLGVVAVASGACGACFSALPPQRVNEARLADRLVTCEACGVILVWDEEVSGG